MTAVSYGKEWALIKKEMMLVFWRVKANSPVIVSEPCPLERLFSWVSKQMNLFPSLTMVEKGLFCGLSQKKWDRNMN